MIFIAVIAVIVGGVFLTIGLVNRSKSGAIITNTHEIDGTFNNLNIDLATAALEIKVAEGDKVRVVCDEKEKVYHSVSIIDNAHTIKVEDVRKWYEKLLFCLRRMKVTIYLSEGLW